MLLFDIVCLTHKIPDTLLLTKEIERAGMTVVHAWHTGNRALIAKYQGEDVARASTALARQELRVQKWAKDLLVAIRAVRAA